MTAQVLVQGTLFHSPEQRTGKTSGKNFVAATIKVRDGEAAQFWQVLAFSAEAQNELLRLDDGDALSVQGGLRAEAYEKGGEPRVSLTVLADAVLPLRRPRKRQEPERQERGTAYDDAIPF
jgi:single-stranded DNA-binding protein